LLDVEIDEQRVDTREPGRRLERRLGNPDRLAQRHLGVQQPIGVISSFNIEVRGRCRVVDPDHNRDRSAVGEGWQHGHLVDLKRFSHVLQHVVRVFGLLRDRLCCRTSRQPRLSVRWRLGIGRGRSARRGSSAPRQAGQT